MRWNAPPHTPPVLAEMVETSRPVDVESSQNIAIAPARQRARDRSRAGHAAFFTVAVVVLAAAALLEVRGEVQVEIFGAVLPELCLWRRVLGWNCPGCGITRSFVSLAHGDFAAAWRFHLAGPALFMAVAFQLPYRGLKLWRLSQGDKEANKP